MSQGEQFRNQRKKYKKKGASPASSVDSSGAAPVQGSPSCASKASIAPVTAPAASVGNNSDRGASGERYRRSVACKGNSAASSRDELHLLPARINGHGPKNGKEICLEVNCFPLMIKNPDVVFYQYDVVIEPDRPKYMLRPVWLEFVKRNFPGRKLPYDGKKIAFGSKPLTTGAPLTDRFPVVNPENSRVNEYAVTIKLANKIEMRKILDFISSGGKNVPAPMEGLAALDIALRNSAADVLIKCGRIFYERSEGRAISLGGGMEMRAGFYQSVRLGSKLYLNVNSCYKGFPTTDLMKVISEICLLGHNYQPDSVLTDRQIQSLEAFLEGLKVEYRIPGDETFRRVYRVRQVSRLAAEGLLFSVDGETTSVANYFTVKKNYTLKYPKLPCLCVGSVENKIYIPIELCKIVADQATTMKMGNQQMSKLIKKCGEMRPTERKNNIRTYVRNNNYDNEYEVCVCEEMEKVKGHVIDPPELKTGAPVSVRKGQWRSDSFHVAKALKNWCVLNLAEDSNLERILIEGICSRGEAMGMKVDLPLRRCILDPGRRSRVQLSNELRNEFEKLQSASVDIVFVMFSIPWLYQIVKKESEIRVGILTQCVRARTLAVRGNESLFSNLLLKVNKKLNGVNHVISQKSVPECLTKAAMVVGADVTHPSPDERRIPSLAAVTASYDVNAVDYRVIHKIQRPKEEIIGNLEITMKDHLLFFVGKRKCKPELIIFFRDGVSDGDIGKVFKEEVLAVKRACHDALQCCPPLLYVIVQKRHHVRFFPVTSDPRNPNVPPGTCVDTTVTNPQYFEFYLVSHHSPLGTARPIRYIVLCNEPKMSEDDVKTVAHYLCHLTSTCSKSTSYPAPTYYAHRAAARGRNSIREMDEKRFEVGLGEDTNPIFVSPKLANHTMYFI